MGIFTKTESDDIKNWKLYWNGGKQNRQTLNINNTYKILVPIT